MDNRVLVITSNVEDADTLTDILGKTDDGPFVIETLTNMGQALRRLPHGGIDAILVDLTLADSVGIETFDQLFAIIPRVPILTLCTAGDEPLAREAVQRGAQGYITKGHFSSYLVPQSLRNIIHRKAVEEATFIDKSRAEVTLNSISDAVIGTKMNGEIDYLNAAAEKMTGWSKDEALGHPISEVMRIINGATRKVDRNPIEMAIQKDKPMGMAAGTILVRRDGSESEIADSAAPIHDLNGQISGAVIVFHDVSDAKAMASKMARQAQYDFLTNLPNRVLLNDRIAHAIAIADRSDTRLAALFLDLDNFKHINDSLGHATGDKLLQSVAERLTSCVRHSDTVSRLGGDEFVVLIGQENSASNAALTANKILIALAAPHVIDENELHVTTSVGISVYPADASDPDTLLKNADMAMYLAKERGRNNYQFFNKAMNTRAVERQEIESHLRHALQRKELALHYQPKINLESGEITGSEALLRWIHPDWGSIDPDRFIAIAEDFGLIHPIGNWVLREACKQYVCWKAAGLNPGSIAVNVSAVEFRRKDFVSGVRDILEDTQLEPECLQLEITESALMRDAENSREILRQLKKLGILLAIDDFGTGYSSLSHLRKFPIDVLKIDRSFVHDIVSLNGDSCIVSAIIALGACLNQHVVAEGVEDQRQLEFLKEQHCEEGQGFFFSRAVEEAKFANLLTAQFPALSVIS